MREAYTKNTEAVCKYEEVESGVLNYPLYGPMVQAFTAGNMPGLAEKVRAVHSQCKDFARLGTFTENHDTPRLASLINDTTLAKNAMAFNILSDGIPVDSPLFNTKSTLNKLRNHAIRLDKHYVSNHSEELYLDGTTYATCKGIDGSQIVSVFSNQGSQGGPYDLTIPGAFKPGTEAIDALSCERVTADHEGKIIIEMDEGERRLSFLLER